MSIDHALLRDGGQVLVRPSAASDRLAVEDFFSRLSPESRGLPFHSASALDARIRLGTTPVGYSPRVLQVIFRSPPASFRGPSGDLDYS
jgi:hypothetical protein